MTQRFTQTEVLKVDLLHVHRYNCIPLVPRKTRKRLLGEDDAESVYSSLGIDDPSFIVLSDVAIEGEYTLKRDNVVGDNSGGGDGDDNDDGEGKLLPDWPEGEMIKVDDVKLDVKGSMLKVKNRPRSKISSNVIVELKIENQQLMERLAIENRILNKKKRALLKVQEANLYITILSKTSDHYNISIQITYKISALESLFLTIPSHDVVSYISDIIPLISTDITITSNNIPITTNSFYEMICNKTQLYPKPSKPPLVSELDTELLPFQGATVNWLLTKENMKYDEDKRSVTPIPIWDESKSINANDDDIMNALDHLSFGFKIIKLNGIDGKIWYNQYNQNICSHSKVLKFLSTYDFSSKGSGLLAEEMGLGKTVEMVALMLLNQRPLKSLSNPTYYDYDLQRSVTKIKSTLIICPETILHQWKDEIEYHSPSLSIMVYNGVNKSNKSCSEIAKEMGEHDVILTTYSTISREIHNAMYNPYTRPKRTKREAVSKKLVLSFDKNFIDKEALDSLNQIYEDVGDNEKILRDREDFSSPLVMVEFWRLMLDEVQMVGKTASNVCKTATMIPRYHSWGVSGTPIKNDLTDLNSLLSFLKINPFYGSKTNKNWNLLFKNSLHFIKLFENLSFRHTKSMVINDIQLPPQRKYLLSVPFGPIEQNNYEELYKQFLREVGLDNMGNPIANEWEPSPSYYEYMTYWLKKLRRICCHANITDNNNLDRPNLQTMDKVLDNMIKSSMERNFQLEKDITLCYLEIGQIKEFQKKPNEALDSWEKELPVVMKRIEDIRSRDNKNDDFNSIHIRLNLQLLHRLYYFIASAHFQLYNPPLEILVPGIKLKKLPHLLSDHSIDPTLNEEDDEDAVNPEDVTVYRVLNPEEMNHQNLEIEYYSKAQDVRRELLSDPIKNVNFAVRNLPVDFHLQYIDFEPYGSKILDIQAFITRVGSVIAQLNSQAKTLNSWIVDMIKTVKNPLFDSVTDPSGDEYSGSLDDQEKFAAYLDVLQRSIQDRSALVFGKVANDHTYENIDTLTDSSNSIFKKELEENYPKMNLTNSLRNLLITTKSIMAELNSSEDLEKLSKLVFDLKGIFEEQKTNLNDGKKFFRNLNDCFNLRINYFRQLQELSDTVRPFDEYTHRNYDTKLNHENLLNRINENRTQLSSVNSRIRYLKSLTSNSSNESEKMCAICRCTITIGSITKCGHQYCKDCLNHWLARHSGCPICKQKITKTDVYNYTYNKEEINVRMITDDESNGGNNEIFQVYEKMDLTEINSIKIRNNFGSKINTIVKQVLYLKKKNPNVQIVVYSQWAPLLDILSNAFTQNGIQFLGSKHTLPRTGSGGPAKRKSDISKFKKDSRITCFLLNAKAEASGLTLVNAEHVFICEPLVNTALELQAISRIHRIGQKKETSVWMFSITGSVEESIILLSTRKKIKLSEKLDTQELQKNFTKLVEANGESVGKDDLWNSFFSNKIDRIV